jgi:hypothetical protein
MRLEAYEKIFRLLQEECHKTESSYARRSKHLTQSSGKSRVGFRIPTGSTHPARLERSRRGAREAHGEYTTPQHFHCSRSGAGGLEKALATQCHSRAILLRKLCSRNLKEVRGASPGGAENANAAGA